jgi:hypothetical protein
MKLPVCSGQIKQFSLLTEGLRFVLQLSFMASIFGSIKSTRLALRSRDFFHGVHKRTHCHRIVVVVLKNPLVHGVCDADCCCCLVLRSQQRPHLLHLSHCPDIAVTRKATGGYRPPPRSIGHTMVGHTETQLAFGVRELVIHQGIQSQRLLPRRRGAHFVVPPHRNCPVHLLLARSAPTV